MARNAKYGRYLRLAVEEQIAADEAMYLATDRVIAEYHLDQARRYRAEALRAKTIVLHRLAHTRPRYHPAPTKASSS